MSALFLCWYQRFGIDKLKELRDNYIADHGRDNTPFTLLDVEGEWAKKLANYTDLQIRAGVTVPKDNHINYIIRGSTLEHLTTLRYITLHYITSVLSAKRPCPAVSAI